MKLSDLLEASQGQEPQKRDSDWNISDRDMEIVYNALRNCGELDQTEVLPLAQQLVDEFDGYSKNVGSARFLINRMHVIMHGMAPLGVTEHSAQQFFQPARPLIRFMAEKGYNPEEAINMARDEARTRKQRRKAEEARQVMADYYKKIRQTLTPKQDKALRASREQILQGLMAGENPEDVFGQVV